MTKKEEIKRHTRIRWLMVFYDLLIYIAVCVLLSGASNINKLSLHDMAIQSFLCGVILILVRIVFGVYRQIWRYGGIQSYFLLLISDALAFIMYYSLQLVIFNGSFSFIRCLALISIDLLGVLATRMVYRYTYKCCDKNTWYGRFLLTMFRMLGAVDFRINDNSVPKVRIAIIGAGRTGDSLAEELFSLGSSPYEPVLFLDNDNEKIGRELRGVPVFNEKTISADRLRDFDIREIVIAIQNLDISEKKNLYIKYSNLGYKVKVYDYPMMESAGRRSIREFDIEEILFRKQINIELDKAKEFYKGKRILITGGGGSIGSEICRQLAKMNPQQLIVVDIYENGAYDVQQEIRIKYNSEIEINIEIASVVNKTALKRVFEEYQPQVVIMAAAHKHVPLMEKNCIEAVENNIYGTLNTIELSEEFGVERVIMVSTDKAVNPTNIMGATKRFCEMMVLAFSSRGSKTTYSATRFGNVLGSAGSVVPLFKKQINSGGPITITDKRIVRYFMTISEASQLVLVSGAIAKNGELFVLDMGQPVKIVDLAQSMIRLSGVDNIEIVETGLRPGEKLYEELLVNHDELQKTDNELIFIERDENLGLDEINHRLHKLDEAIASDSDDAVRSVLHEIVPTFIQQ